MEALLRTKGKASRAIKMRWPARDALRVITGMKREFRGWRDGSVLRDPLLLQKTGVQFPPPTAGGSVAPELQWELK